MNQIKPKRPMSLATFLKEASSAGSGIKYSAEKAKTHRLYIPRMAWTETDENGQTVTTYYPFAEMHNIHEWKSGDKFYAAECVTDKYGNCPYCDRVQDAWDVYNERLSAAEQELRAQGLDEATIQYKLNGETDKDKRRQPNAYKGLKSVFGDELKMKAAKPYLYLLVAQYETDPTGQTPVLDKGLPKFALKVIKLPSGQVEKFQAAVANSGGVLEGNEITIAYKDLEGRAELVGQRTVAAVFPNYSFIAAYPGLQEKIEEEASKFDMESISKSFDELKALEPAACKSLADSGFAKWDTFKSQKAIGAAVVYNEYPSAVAAANAPALTAAQGMTFGLPTAPAAQQVAPAAQQAAPQVQMPQVQQTVAQPMQQAPVQMPVQQTVAQEAAPVQQAAPMQQTPPVQQSSPLMPPNAQAAAANQPAPTQNGFQFAI